MRHFLIAALLAVTAVSAAGCAATSGGTMIARESVMETARRVTERYASAWNESDWTEFGALYAADARHVTMGGGFLRGRPAIVAAHRDNRARYAQSVRMVTRLEGARAITNDAIVAVMLIEYVGDPASRIQSARVTLTLARRSGNWSIAQAQASSPT